MDATEEIGCSVIGLITKEEAKEVSKNYLQQSEWSRKWWESIKMKEKLLKEIIKFSKPDTSPEEYQKLRKNMVEEYGEDLVKECEQAVAKAALGGKAPIVNQVHDSVEIIVED